MYSFLTFYTFDTIPLIIISSNILLKNIFLFFVCIVVIVFGIVSDRSIRAQQASSTQQCEYGGNKNVRVYSYCAVLCAVLAVMCICVI